MWRARGRLIAVGGLLAVLLLVLAAVLLSVQRPESTAGAIESAGDTGTSGEIAERDVPPQAGIRAYKDPVTGKIGPPPPGKRVKRGPLGRAGLPEAPIVRPSPVPGGGVIADFQGRFRIPEVARKGADGKITIDHGGEVGKPRNRE
jgi:hypothetical protein